MSATQGTLKPTAARIRELRERGDIARSRDAVSAAALAGAVTGLLLSAGDSWRALTALTLRACQRPVAEEALPLARQGLEIAILAAAPVLAGACLAAALAIALQLGWPPVFWPRARARARRAPLDSPSPLGQLRQAFGLAAMSRRTILTLAKAATIGAAFAFALSPRRALQLTSAQQLQDALVACCARALVACAAVILALGVLDYAWAYHRLTRRRLMTPDELRREVRELEGDPAIRARRSRRRQELARRRLTQAIEAALDGADALILAPGEAAVALRYRRHADAAPRLLARGRGTLAERIATLARERGIPTFERPALARALAALPEGEALPAALYRAVAEVLALILAPTAASAPTAAAAARGDRP